MKKILVLALILISGGCHRDHPGRFVALPSLPAQKSSVPVESTALATAVKSGPTPASETIVSVPERSEPLKSSINELLLDLADAFFNLDQHELRPDASVALRQDASTLQSILAQSPNTKMIVEGHCDERGSAEYNLALGAMRAEAAKSLLLELGVPKTALKTISYGKEHPQCTTPIEECWQKNRRAHLSPEQ